MAIQKLSESKVLRAVEKQLPYGIKRDYEWSGSIKNYSKEHQDLAHQYFKIKHKLSFLRENLVRANRRTEYKQDIQVNLDYIFEVGENQNWLCAATGQPLEFERGGTHWGGKWCNPKSCTIDRIDNSKGYVKSNIQLVTWEANCLRSNIDWNDFVTLCKLVAKHNK